MTAEQKMIYLATPYSHEDWAVRLDRAVAAGRLQAILRRRTSLPVYSPIVQSHYGCVKLQGLPWRHPMYLEQDLAVLRSGWVDCVVIGMLSGFERSAGVRAETDLALELGLPVLYVKANGDPVAYYSESETVLAICRGFGRFAEEPLRPGW